VRGGDRQVNLEIANSVLAGASGPRRDIVLVNAAAALVAAGRAETFPEAMALGVVSIDSGAARGKVRRWRGSGGEGGAATRGKCRIVFPGTGVRQKLWGNPPDSL
jgi:anthranilate phosphoribosyltransferase